MKDIIIGTCEKCGQNFAHNCRCKYKPMNNTYTANENCFLIDGEVYFTDKTIPYKSGEYYVDLVYNKIMKAPEKCFPMLISTAFKITHSTKPLDGVKQLPRDKFVKPKDVDLLSEFERLKGYECDRFDNEEWIEYEWFKQGAGHNANPNSFTGEQLDEAAKLAFRHGQSNMMNEWQSFNEIKRHFAPVLSLPASLEINEQGEIVNVIWI